MRRAARRFVSCAAAAGLAASAWGDAPVTALDAARTATLAAAESAIRIVRKDSILIGEGMEASPDLSTVRIFHHQASIYPKNLTDKK